MILKLFSNQLSTGINQSEQMLTAATEQGLSHSLEHWEGVQGGDSGGASEVVGISLMEILTQGHKSTYLQEYSLQCHLV